MSSLKKQVLYSVVAALFISMTSCKQDATVVEDNQAHTDSLMKTINSPELKAINQKILENPSSADLYNQRAKIYLQFKQLEDAVSDAKRAIRIDSTKADYYLTEADVFFAGNRTRNAKDALELIAKKFPTNTDGLLKLAELYYFVKQYDNAFEKINQALKVNENIAKAYYLKGNIYKETGDTAKAISSLETALEQDNKNYGAFLDLGIIYAARRNTIAFEYYDNALSVSPGSVEVLYAKAKLLQDINKADEAIVIYEQILKTDSLNVYALFNIGAIQIDIKKDAKKALEYFTKAISINPKYAEAYFARGACYQELKDNGNAKADYSMCLQLKPNYDPAIDGLNSLGN